MTWGRLTNDVQRPTRRQRLSFNSGRSRRGGPLQRRVIPLREVRRPAALGAPAWRLPKIVSAANALAAAPSSSCPVAPPHGEDRGDAAHSGHEPERDGELRRPAESRAGIAAI